MIITFTVPTRPAGQPRARVGVIGGKARAFKSKQARTLEADILAFAIPAAPPQPLEGPVRVEIVATMPITESWPAWRRDAARANVVCPTGRPDIDNVAKLILDALNRSFRFWRDDAQVVELIARKRYGDEPGTSVAVYPACALVRTAKEWAEWQTRRDVA
jgi:Holliday junction resolvase RusA-like endonuclease